jgi:hypothetical protein
MIGERGKDLIADQAANVLFGWSPSLKGLASVVDPFPQCRVPKPSPRTPTLRPRYPAASNAARRMTARSPRPTAPQTTPESRPRPVAARRPHQRLRMDTNSSHSTTPRTTCRATRGTCTRPRPRPRRTTPLRTLTTMAMRMGTPTRTRRCRST